MTGDVVDLPYTVESKGVREVDDKQARDKSFIVQSRKLEPKARLAAITKAYLEDKITAGTMSFELVDMFPFDDGPRSRFEMRLRDKYAALHPSLNDMDDSTTPIKSALKDALY